MSMKTPGQVVREMTLGHLAPRCLQVIAQFGVADALDDHPASVAQLAARTGMNADALGRMLRLLAAHGVFACGTQGYLHTEASKLLRRDHPQSLHSFARMIGMPIIWNGFTHLAQAAQSGKPANDWTALMAHFEAHEDEGRLFNAAMADKAGEAIAPILDAYDFSRFDRIADIGGGRAHLLRAILESIPAASGTLFELPHVVADAAQMASPRLSLVAGDFFTSVLPVADCYLLMEVLHDWGDGQATAILEAISRVAPDHARVVIVESLISDAPGLNWATTLDIVMLAITGGRERTSSEYATLLASAGFRLERVLPTSSAYSVMEAVVA